jgi:imidazolonepropionase-like amidohydrolase
VSAMMRNSARGPRRAELIARALAGGLALALAATSAGTFAARKSTSTAAKKDTKTAPGTEAPAPAPPGPVLVRNATLWTMGPEGIVTRGDLLVVDGKISKVGGTIAAPSGATVIDAAGKHVTPGIIDCHSHTAIDGDVNEATHNVTAEVRIGDVVDNEDWNIYRQLAGGTTTANALHGSANSIGGQNAVLRWKWRRAASELRFAGAPEGIKFALGENPKQSNWGDAASDRYPKSRMGVEESIRAAFNAARDNKAAWQKEKDALGKKDDHRVPPRKDLQLDALNEILDGTRFIHSHSYRADEILMLMRLGDSIGFKVRTFQHVLEGYRVADEMAAHHAGGSTFADWWAYKIEAYEAIPHNAALMTRRGVLSSVNSDSGELARHLNFEAAKSMKFGGLTPEESLALVTINPAKQLGIDARVGSLEPGKDGDFVVWSGDPLSVYTIAESTWIEGTKYFDRDEDLARRKDIEAERAALIQKVKDEAKKEEAKKEEAKKDEKKGDAAGASQDDKEAAKNKDAKDTDAAPETPEPIKEAQVGPVNAADRPGAVPSEGPVTALVGATIHTVSGADIPNGVVLMRGGKIAAVGAGVAVPPGAARVDLSGKHLYPSMIDPDTNLGLVEIGSVKGSVDTNEVGRINPDIHVEVAFHPASESIPVTRANGILVALVVPNGSFLRGTSALMKLDGWTWEEALEQARVGMHVSWPRTATPVHGWEPKKSGDDIRKEKTEALKDLDKAVESARAYQKAKEAAGKGDGPRLDVDTRWEAMIPLITGKIPLIAEANDVQQIEDAIAWGEKQKIPVIIQGGRDAWRVTELLVKKHVPVILGPTLAVPAREDEPYDTAYAQPAKLHDAGVPFAISAGGYFNVRILPYQAGMAASFGLPRDAALRSVTLDAARILGVGSRLGSIEVGKDATLFASDGDPLEMRTQILQAWIDGREVSLDNKHKELYEKYRNRPRPEVAAK